MLSNPFNTPLALEIKPSLQKWLIIVIPHLLVLTLVLSLSVFSLSLRFALSFLIIFSSAYYIRLYLQGASKKSVRMIFQDSRKNWLIKTIKTDKQKVQLLGTSFISKLLIIMNVIDTDKNKYTILITPDSLSSTEFRRVFVRLKMTKL